MFKLNSNVRSILSDFRTDSMMRYSQFVPKLYNLCCSLGFAQGSIIPSRAFCSDENQGYPIILIAKHFAAFPFNHGRVGGIVATDRHGPHAHHGKDLVIIQASHVGYDPEAKEFGNYCRLQTEGHNNSPCCGKIDSILTWYENEYDFAKKNIFLVKEKGEYTLRIDNQLLDKNKPEGLFINLDSLIGKDATVQYVLSTSKVYLASKAFVKTMPEDAWGKTIGDFLEPELFAFKRVVSTEAEGQDHLECNLIKSMPWILTAKEPMLAAAQINTQAEFDRAYRSIVKSEDYHNKNLFFISCVNIDISPKEGQIFPLTKCIPWAAYHQDDKGNSRTIEQTELLAMLDKQGFDNPNQIDLEAAIDVMMDTQEVIIKNM